MANEQGVAHYIEEERAKGRTDQEITHDLLEAGWQMDVIRHALHGEPIKLRNFEPILDIKRQPIRKSFIVGVVVFVILLLLAAFA